MTADRNQDRTLCHYRLMQAEETLAECGLLKEAAHYRGAVNRAYYAMFYAVQVLIVSDKVYISKHSGAISYFDREYVKRGIIEKTFSKWLHRLFDLRQDADYGDMYEPTKEQCEQAENQARQFVDRIKEHYANRSDT